MVVFPLLVSIIGVTISGGLLYIGLQRYRREIPRKGLSYSADSDSRIVRVHVWNSGNVAIEQEDYLSPVGFNLGKEAHLQDVYVEDQEPEDLGIEAKALDSGRIEIPPIYLNPQDRFTLRMTLSNSGSASNPKPYGRIRGVHQLFREVEDTPSASERYSGAAHKSSSSEHDRAILLIQALGPAILGIIGTIITAIIATVAN